MKSLRRFRPDISSEQLALAVRTDGAAVIEDLVDPAVLDKVAQEILPYVEKTPTGNVSFAGLATKRTGGLMGRSATAREQLIMHPLILAAGGLVLAKSPTMQLMNTEIISIGAGEPAQPLHRDQDVWDFPFPPLYEPEFSVMWAMSDFTVENGATRLILDSHRVGPGSKADESQTQQATMRKGSVLMWTGSLYHGGGENRSSETRHGVNVAYALGWLRQEENQYLAVRPEVAATLPDEALKLMGYRRHGFSLGNAVDRSEPLGVLREGISRPGYIDLGSSEQTADLGPFAAFKEELTTS